MGAENERTKPSDYFVRKDGSEGAEFDDFVYRNNSMRGFSGTFFVSAEAFLYLYAKGAVFTMKKRMSLNANKSAKEYIDAKALSL